MLDHVEQLLEHERQHGDASDGAERDGADDDGLFELAALAAATITTMAIRRWRWTIHYGTYHT